MRFTQASVKVYCTEVWPVDLESQRGEEPLILSCVVALLELLLDEGTALLASLWSLCVSAWGGEGSQVDVRLDGVAEVEGVAGGHEVVVVDDLDEYGQVGAEGDLPLRHGLLHTARVLLNACDDAMPVRMLVRAVILVLQDDRLLAGILALQEDHDLRWFQTTRGGAKR